VEEGVFRTPIHPGRVPRRVQPSQKVLTGQEMVDQDEVGMFTESLLLKDARMYLMIHPGQPLSLSARTSR
jgi:hypothetical protein